MMTLRKLLLFFLLLAAAISLMGRWGAQPGLAAETTPSPIPTTANDEISSNVSPDGRWTALVNTTAGSLDLQGPDGQTVNLFPSGSTIDTVDWSPDSRHLLAVQTGWFFNEPRGTGVSSHTPITIWQIDIKADKPQPARLVFQSPTPAGPDAAEQIRFGHWSPNSHYVLFWLGPLGASILADGLPVLVLDVTTEKAMPVAEFALLNPRYQSWSPDSSGLVVTAGADRVAQSNKWLVLWEAATGKSTTIISQTEQIPGIVAWSPQGDSIAYAAVSAVSAAQTDDDSYHVAGFDNPAIAGRRIYLLNPATGQTSRLNDAARFQDNPRWSDDGKILYYIQRQLDTLQLMAANPQTGQAEAVPGVSMPLPQYIGYYGQSELDWLLDYRPGGESAGQPLPTPEISPTAVTDQINETTSPDGRWTALVNQTIGSLALRRQADGQTVTVFPSGDTAFTVSWSPDSRRLLVVRTNWTPAVTDTGIQANGPIEIWQVELIADEPAEPTRLYQSPSSPDEEPQQIVFGHWSPNNRYILFWKGILSASILADGLPVFALDVTTGQVTPLAEISLPNPRYQSWSPDSSALAITAGGYRSAQVDKWLAVWDPATGQVTTVISQTEQVPGIVAWSPQGHLIAYAAVPADKTGPEWADRGGFDNPAIAARRIYLLDPATGQSHRLNQADGFQDAPVWSNDGTILYYVQQEENKLALLAADPTTGQTKTVIGAEMPLPELVGYYGQSDFEAMLALRPGGAAVTPAATITATVTATSTRSIK